MESENNVTNDHALIRGQLKSSVGMMEIFSDEIANIFIVVNLLFISTGFSIFGIATNIINVIVFFKQGFQENLNISLFAIAISDICVCLTHVWLAVCYNPLLLDSDPSFLPHEVELLTAGQPHVMAVNVSAWLTAAVTFERCLCITYPLKVKSLMTRTRTTVFVISLFIVVVVLNLPIFITVRLGWKFVLPLNQTKFGLIFEENSGIVQEITFFVCGFLSLLVSFAIVLVCTIILVLTLKRKSKWRQTSTVSANVEDVTAKNKRVISMVAVVACVFLFGYTPSVVLAVFLTVEPDFRGYGEYGNNFIVALTVSSVFKSVNASINILVYFHMSTKFRICCRKVLCLREEDLQPSQQKLGF